MLPLMRVRSWPGLVLALLAFAACSDPSAPSPVASATAASQAPEPSPSSTAAALQPPPRPRPTLPAEPPPSAPELAHEVPKIEAELATYPVYAGLWTTTEKGDRDLLLTLVSVIMTENGIVGERMIAAGKAKPKIQEAAIKLFLLFTRTGTFPSAFMAGLSAYLDKLQGEPNMGTWAAGPPPHDFTALAAWARREDPRYLRALLAARAAEHFGYRFVAHEQPVDRPWLAEELAALERLALLDTLTPAETARLVEVKAEASVVRVPIADLIDDYKDNEIRGDQRFKGKVVETTGALLSISKDAFGKAFLVLGKGSGFELNGVHCMLIDKSIEPASKLSKGGRATVRGTVTGLILGSVVISGCELR